MVAVVMMIAFDASADIQVPGGGGRAYQIAVQHFLTTEGTARFGEPFYNELTEALEYSSVFKVVPQAAFLGPRQTRDFRTQVVACENWRGIGADGLVQGSLERKGGRLRARFRVWDVLRCERQGRVQYFEDAPDALPLLARRVADEIVYLFSGRRGVSSTQIAFVSDKTGNKEIYVMHADGSNPRRVTGNGSINLFPSWSPTGDTLIYTSMRGGWFDLWTLTRGPNRGHRLLNDPSHKYRGVWATHDKSIAITMHKGGNTDLYSMRYGRQGLRRLTTSRFIDNSPSWSPDGKRIAFMSDRSGSPQIYVKDLKSGDERRLTFRGSYNASPAWSPQGNWILFTGKTSTGSFDIYVIDATSGYTTPLVVHPRGDEDPAWSPDGRKIVFSSARRGRKELYQVDFDGRNLRRIVDGMGNSTNPAWSPWLD
jgi:TolB protein